MPYLHDEIMRAAKATRATISELSFQDSALLARDLAVKFAAGATARFLWEDFSEAASVQDPDGWQWIGEYIKHHQALLLVYDEEAPAAFEFADGSQIVPVLAETFHFEFLITNRVLDYALCFNHHDFLIATGTAISWLEQKRG